MTRHATITGVGSVLPPTRVPNTWFEDKVATTDEWIRERTGIEARHFAEDGVVTSDLAVDAATRALESAGVSAAQVDLIVCASVTGDTPFPSTAVWVQHKLGMKGAWGFDLSAACSAFLYALQTGAQFIASGAHKKVLVIGSDVMSSILDYTDRATCILFGDGAGAVILEQAQEDEGIIDFVHEIDGSGACALYMPGGGSLHPSTHESVDKKMHFVHQDGQAVFKYAVRKMGEVCEKLLARNGVKASDIDCFIPHQANQRIIKATADRIGLKPEIIIINIDRYGNTTAGTIPLAMQTAREEGRLKKGDLVLLASVGAGFTIGATLLRWTL